ncbi:MAG: peptidase [Sphingobacteriales bacterium]|nr:peptidase [Sphingobacteriales bacterium]
MSKLYKFLLAILIVSSSSFKVTGQLPYWSLNNESGRITTDKAVARQTFPKEFRLFDLNIDPLRQQLFSIVGANAGRHSAIITLPNANGGFEQFEVVEASNFEPALQARFPEIRAYSGKGIQDPSAMLKLSISPQGIQTMVFRTNGPNEYIEPYSDNHHTYAAFKSQRNKGELPWVCSTPDQQLAANLNNSVTGAGLLESSAGELKTVRLAQSCNGEYSNWFGATSSAQVALVLAAFNATLTRCNGCYEKDLALHLNLIATTTQVIYYDPATDPYTTMGSWNGQLQATLTAVIGEANYDIGHMFGASGGGGNAGCIGCVCVDGIKGSGITSPADGIPQGDNFDIDYVAHEVGHQLGGNHTFSMSNEGTGVNKEVGSGITIMGYAGITSQDVAPHSIDIFHEATIQQIQVNMAGKTCPITTNITANNATPVVAPVSNYTIPITTPFALTGSATDANAGDVLTYCWEQNDNSTTTGSNSVASPTKVTGPNWLSFSPVTTGTRLFPRLSTILTGASVTGPLPGGDAGANIEALSSVARTLNFRLTVRDNSPYSSAPPVKVGQTAFTDMVVTVDATTGPFLITSQNAATNWVGGSTQTVTWSVNGTTGAPINCANVKISFSSDGGVTFPVVLAASTPNDGTENIAVPVDPTGNGRVKVEAIGNIFFDINNAVITITPPPNGFTFNSPAPVTAACPAPDVMTSGNLTATWVGTFTGDVSLSGSVNPAGPTVSFGSTTLTQVSPSTTVSLTGMSTLSPGNYTVTVTGTGTGAPTQTRDIVFTINPGSGPAITTQPASQAACAGADAVFTVVATGTYQWQLSTNGGSSWADIAGATAVSYTVTGTTTAQNNYQYRVIVTGQCGSTTSAAATLTVNEAPAITGQPQSLNLCSGSAASFTVTATGTALTYQWELSTDGGTTYNPIAGATAATYDIAAVAVTDNNNMYRCVVSGTCAPAATSSAATLLVSASITITTNPADQTVCEATNVSFTVAAGGSGLSYQWQISTDGGTTFTDLANTGNYSGATTTTMTITGVLPSQNNYRFRAIASNAACNPGISTAAILTVNTFPVITAQPVSATICAGAAQTFGVTATTGVGTLTYQWQLSINGGSSWSNITGATSATFAQPSIPAGQNGYRFRVVVTAGCGSVTSNGAVLTVNTYPVIDFSLQAVTCVSDPAFSISASPAGGAFSGSGVSGTTFTPTVAGVGAKTVSYTVSNAACQSVANRVILVNECAERHVTLDRYGSVTIYPNPSNGLFRLRLNSDLYSKLNIRVYNAAGTLVKTQLANGLTYGSLVSVDISHLAGGTYHLFLSNDENGSFVSKGVSVIVFK